MDQSYGTSWPWRCSKHHMLQVAQVSLFSVLLKVFVKYVIVLDVLFRIVFHPTFKATFSGSHAMVKQYRSTASSADDRGLSQDSAPQALPGLTGTSHQRRALNRGSDSAPKALLQPRPLPRLWPLRAPFPKHRSRSRTWASPQWFLLQQPALPVKIPSSLSGSVSRSGSLMGLPSPDTVP